MDAERLQFIAFQSCHPRRFAPSGGVFGYRRRFRLYLLRRCDRRWWRSQSLTVRTIVSLSKSVVVCVAVVVICGCDGSQPTTPVLIPVPTPPVATNNPTRVELPESADSIGIKFKLIPAGTFTMGGEDDEAHEVTLAKPFQMGVHEVTQDQYEKVMGNNPSEFFGTDNPVEMVSWEDAVEFCGKLSALPAEKAAGNVYRLPTEAEWE